MVILRQPENHPGIKAVKLLLHVSVFASWINFKGKTALRIKIRVTTEYYFVVTRILSYYSIRRRIVRICSRELNSQYGLALTNFILIIIKVHSIYLTYTLKLVIQQQAERTFATPTRSMCHLVVAIVLRTEITGYWLNYII